MRRLLIFVQIVFHCDVELHVKFHHLSPCQVLYCITQSNMWADFDICGRTHMMSATALSKQLAQ